MDDIVEYHTFYASAPTTAGGGRPDLIVMEKWLSREMRRPVRIPDLNREGYGFETARLLLYEDRPIAQIVYRSADGSVIALCVVSAEKAEARSFELKRRRGFALITWQRAGSLYVAIGEAPVDRLRAFSRAVATSLQQTWPAGL